MADRGIHAIRYLYCVLSDNRTDVFYELPCYNPVRCFNDVQGYITCQPSGSLLGHYCRTGASASCYLDGPYLELLVPAGQLADSTLAHLHPDERWHSDRTDV